jgi:CBS domain containing-hemolysin-like protein
MIAVAVILLLCILFEALFSGTELALVSADKVRLRHHAEGAGRRGKLIIAFLDDPGELITTSLVGTNICVVLSTVVATLTLLQWFPHRAELISLAVMTPLVLIFGEIVPKSVFQAYADQIAPKAIYALWLFRLMVYPLVALGGLFSRALLRALGLDRQQAVMTREELGLLLRLPSREGADRITADEKRMVTRAFDFKSLTVEQVMVPLSEVTALPVDCSLEEVAQEVADKQHTRIPLYQERLDQIVGIVHAYEVLRAREGESPRELCRPAIFVPESQLAVDTLFRLQREGHGMAVVVDEYGGATGVITVEDILEEIVGDIADEYDEEEVQLVTKEGQGVYRVVAKAPVDRVNDLLRLNLPESEEYESIAGLVLDQVRRIPPVGHEIRLGRVTLTVTRGTERGIDEVRLTVGRKKR